MSLGNNDLNITKNNKDIYFKILDTADLTNTVFTDITGQFPTISSQGHCYIFVMYIHDYNALTPTTVRLHTEDVIMSAFFTLLDIINS